MMRGVLSAERKRPLRRGRAAMARGRKKRKKNRTTNGLGAAVLSQEYERERMAVWQMARESGRKKSDQPGLKNEDHRGSCVQRRKISPMGGGGWVKEKEDFCLGFLFSFYLSKLPPQNYKMTPPFA